MSIIGKIVAHRVASILEDSVLMQGTIVSGYQSKRAFGWTVQAILLLMIFFVGCAHRSDWAARIEWDTLEFGALPGKEEFPEDEAIIILDEGKMEIFDGSESDLSVF